MRGGAVRQQKSEKLDKQLLEVLSYKENILELFKKKSFSEQDNYNLYVQKAKWKALSANNYGSNHGWKRNMA